LIEALARQSSLRQSHVTNTASQGDTAALNAIESEGNRRRFREETLSLRRAPSLVSWNGDEWVKQRARCHTYTREREKEREREREREQMGESHDDKHDDIDNDNGNEDNKDDDDDNDKGKMFKLVYQFVALTRVCSRSHRRAWSRSRGSNDSVDRPHGSRPSTQRRVDDDNNDSRSLSPPRGETRYSTRLSRQSL